MASVYLPDYILNAGFHLERFVPRLGAQGLSWRQIQEMTTMYRQRAVCSLLLEGTPTSFFVNMMQSAAAFAYFLQGCPDDQKVTSQVKPFQDALCGGYMDAAVSIARGSRNTWNQGYEYEEDFLYAYLVMQMLFLPHSMTDCVALLDRLAAAAAPVDAAKVEVCRSLLTGDSPAFNAALVDLLEIRRERVARMIQLGTLSEELASWFRPFSGEGLALIRIAEKLGMTTEGHYMHVPEEVRPAAPYRFDAEAWRTLDYSPLRK